MRSSYLALQSVGPALEASATGGDERQALYLLGMGSTTFTGFTGFVPPTGANGAANGTINPRRLC